MQHADTVIVTALPLEFEAVRVHLNSLKSVVHPRGTQYEVGSFNRIASTLSVAVVQTGAGNAGAAVESERAIEHFHPQIVLFVGVAGGLKDVEIGDVVAATKVYAYHSGKSAETFKPRPEVGMSSYALVQLANAVARAGTWRKRTRVQPNREPRAFVAPIAAGEEVVASVNSEAYAFLKRSYSDACAIEMEGAGFLRAAYASEGVRKLVIRGISDLIEKKDVADASGSQPIAAAHAAAFAFEILAVADLGHLVRESESESASTPDLWAALERVANELYPLGPRDNEIWRRAGGDLSAIELGSSGRAAWHGALRALRLGGGGSITPESLIEAMKQDYPKNEELSRL